MRTIPPVRDRFPFPWLVVIVTDCQDVPIKQKQQLGEKVEERKGATAIRGGCRVEREENRERGRERQTERGIWRKK